MRTMKAAILATLTVAVLAPAAFADTFNINVAVTGDNLISGWYLDSTGLITLALTGNVGTWQVAKTGTAQNLQYGQVYSLVWQVVNDDHDGGYRAPSAKNPGGFLGQVTDPLGTALSNASDGAWTYAIQPNTIISPTSYAAFNVNTLPLGFNDPSFVWMPVAAYGPNSGGVDIWSRNLTGGTVAGIDPNAQWIWAQSNFGDPGAPGMGTSVFLRYTFDPPGPFTADVPAPEPSLILLLGIGTGAVGVFWSRRKR